MDGPKRFQVGYPKVDCLTVDGLKIIAQNLIVLLIKIFKHKKLGYTPKVISSSHWIFEYELGQPSEMEIPDIESKHFVDVTLFDIYGNVFQKSVNVSTTAWGRQRMRLEFKGMSQNT